MTSFIICGGTKGIIQYSDIFFFWNEWVSMWEQIHIQRINLDQSVTGEGSWEADKRSSHSDCGGCRWTDLNFFESPLMQFNKFTVRVWDLTPCATPNAETDLNSESLLKSNFYQSKTYSALLCWVSFLNLFNLTFISLVLMSGKDTRLDTKLQDFWFRKLCWANKFHFKSTCDFVQAAFQSTLIQYTQENNRAWLIRDFWGWCQHRY